MARRNPLLQRAQGLVSGQRLQRRRPLRPRPQGAADLEGSGPPAPAPAPLPLPPPRLRHRRFPSGRPRLQQVRKWFSVPVRSRPGSSSYIEIYIEVRKYSRLVCTWSANDGCNSYSSGVPHGEYATFSAHEEIRSYLILRGCLSLPNRARRFWRRATPKSKHVILAHTAQRRSFPFPRRRGGYGMVRTMHPHPRGYRLPQSTICSYWQRFVCNSDSVAADSRFSAQVRSTKSSLHLIRCQKPTLFNGSTPHDMSTTTPGGFGGASGASATPAPAPAATSLFGGGGGFGGAAAAAAPAPAAGIFGGAGGFGKSPAPSATPAAAATAAPGTGFGGFGSAATAPASAASTTATTSVFGGGFGAAATPAAAAPAASGGFGGGFGSIAKAPAPALSTTAAASVFGGGFGASVAPTPAAGAGEYEVWTYRHAAATWC